VTTRGRACYTPTMSETPDDQDDGGARDAAPDETPATAAPAVEAQAAALGPLGRPPPTDSRLAEALAAFDVGDHRAARAALGRVDRGRLDEIDRVTAQSLERALRMDPAAYAVGGIMFGVWVFLVARLLV
jgi:hypothetical protein